MKVIDEINSVDTDREHPNTVSRQTAMDIVLQLRANGLEPDRVIADPDGIVVYVFAEQTLNDGSHARYARLAAMNDGEVVVSLADRERDMHEAFDVPAALHSQAIHRIKEFLIR